MTATITDIEEFRAEKNAQHFTKWSDDRLVKRHKLLFHIASGYPGLTTGPLAEMSFKGGFDPDNHPTENIKMVAGELARRGVNVTSA